MLGKVVRFIEAASFPIDMELPVAYAITESLESHVDSFEALLLGSIVGNAGGSVVVGTMCWGVTGWGWPSSSRVLLMRILGHA